MQTTTTTSFQSPSFICDACCCSSCCVAVAAAVVLLLCGLLAGCKHSAYLYSYVCCRGRFWFFPVTATPRPPFPLPSPLTLPATLDCRTTTVICCISNAPVLHLLHVAMLHALFDYRARNCVSHSTTSAFCTHMAPLGLLAWPVFIFVGGIYARRVFWFSIFQLVFLSFSCCFFFLLCSLHAFSITLQHLLASSAEKGKRVKLHAWEILCTRMDKSQEL